MKQLEITVLLEQSENVEDALNQLNILFSSTKVDMGDQACKKFVSLLPDEFMDEIINIISGNIDFRHRENIISVLQVEGVVSTHLDRFKEKAAKINPPLNPLERLIESTDRYTRLSGDVFLFVFFATLIALAGLFLDNVAIVIGAMLLSPLLGPINSFAVNANLGRPKLIIRSQICSLTLLSSIIITSALATFIISQFSVLSITNQIAMRSQISFIDIGIAFILGCAGGLALYTDFPEILVGIAVAVALVPPATVTGIGIAMMNHTLSLGAFLLTIANLLGLQLGCTLSLSVKGVTPRRYYQRVKAKRYSEYSIYILAIMLLILGLIVIVIFR